MLEDTIEPEAIASALAKVALDKKASDVSILDMHTLVDYTDVFVLCTARNRRHVAALAEDIRLQAKRALGLHCLGTEGLPSARWVLVDFGSVVVHIFDEPLRAFYNLDGLWSDAPRLPVPDLDETNLGGADFGGADFGGADFGGADFGGADLDGPDPQDHDQIEVDPLIDELDLDEHNPDEHNLDEHALDEHAPDEDEDEPDGDEPKVDLPHP